MRTVITLRCLACYAMANNALSTRATLPAQPPPLADLFFGGTAFHSFYRSGHILLKHSYAVGIADV